MALACFLNVFFLFTVMSAAAGDRVCRIPLSIRLQMHEISIARGECDPGEERPLGSRYFAGLPDHRLLILLEIPDYMCRYSYTVLPLIFDPRDKTFQTAEPLEGAVQSFQVGPHGRLWLWASWQIEGVRPFIYHTRDGMDWREIPLPERSEGWAPFLYVNKFQFSDSKLRIELLEEDDETRLFTYRALLSDLDKGLCGWETVETGSNGDFKALPPRKPSAVVWSREEKDGRVYFSFENIKVEIPRRLPSGKSD